jgi:hypothetical protein
LRPSRMAKRSPSIMPSNGPRQADKIRSRAHQSCRQPGMRAA